MIFNRDNPTGTITEICSDKIPNLWFLCDGRKLDKDLYVELYTYLKKTNFNLEESANFFNIPDLRNSYLSAKEDVGQIIPAQVPRHSHSGEVKESGAHQHEYHLLQTWKRDSNGDWGKSAPVKGSEVMGTTYMGGVHKHEAEAKQDGVEKGRLNSMVVRYIIKY